VIHFYWETEASTEVQRQSPGSGAVDEVPPEAEKYVNICTSYALACHRGTECKKIYTAVYFNHFVKDSAIHILHVHGVGTKGGAGG